MGFDLDEVCAYSTTRVVRIRDRRLGCLYYGAVFGIVAYIVGYNVIAEQGYKNEVDVVGTIRSSVQSPDESLRPSANDTDYCQVAGGPSTYTGDDGNSFATHPCRFYDGNTAMWPANSDGDLVIATRIKEEDQELVPSVERCAEFAYPECFYNTTEELVYFIPDTELFTVMVDHTMTVPIMDISRAATEMDGELVGLDSKKIDPCGVYTKRGLDCPTFIKVGTQGALDIVPLQAFMDAAGVTSLDMVAGTTPPLDTESKRYAGLTLLVSINYDNYWSYDQESIRYTYQVRSVKNAEFKIEQDVDTALGAPDNVRHILSRHGVRIVFEQAGHVGFFSMAALLVQLVSSLGLLAVATIVVNTLALKCCGLRHIYAQYRQVTSVDFSDISGLPKNQLDRFRTEDLINPRPTIFEGVDLGEGEATALTAGADPAATVVRQAPTIQPKAGGFFAAMGRRQSMDEESNSTGSDLELGTLRSQIVGNAKDGGAASGPSRTTRVKAAGAK